MKQAGLQQANMLAEQVRSEIAARDSELVDILKDITNNQRAQQERSNQTKEVQQHMANATSTNTVQMEILKLLKQMNANMENMGQQQNSAQRGKNGYSQRKPKKSPDNLGNYRFRKDITKYCWTHGACNHNGGDCEFPATGHKNNATFSNKMGGSLAFCQPCEQQSRS